MKFFKTDYNGLLPLLLDDVRFINEGLQEQIEILVASLCEVMHSNHFIITGCEIQGSSPNYNVTEGWIVLNKKLYRVPAASVQTTKDPILLWFFLQENVLPGGQKQPKRTTSTVETHLETTAYLSTATGGSGIITYGEIKRITGSEWTQLDLESPFAHTLNPLQYKQSLNVVELRGAVRIPEGTPGGVTHDVIATLPVELRPANDIQSVVLFETGGTREARMITIDSTTGNIVCPAEFLNDTVYVELMYFLH